MWCNLTYSRVKIVFRFHLHSNENKFVALMVILFVYSVKKSIWCHVQHAKWNCYRECCQEIRFWKILLENILELLRNKISKIIFIGVGLVWLGWSYRWTIWTNSRANLFSSNIFQNLISWHGFLETYYWSLVKVMKFSY